MKSVSDYQLWKCARLVKPTRTITYDIVLGLGGDKSLIEIVEIDLKKKFIEELNIEDFYRFVLFNILIILRNKSESDLFYNNLFVLYDKLGYSDIKFILNENV